MPNRRRHALVVAYDFPPHGAIGTLRTLRVVEKLAADGWHVTVLTGDPRSYRPGTPVDETLLARVSPQVRVVRAGVVRGFEGLKTAAASIVRRTPQQPDRAANGEPKPRGAAASKPSKRGLLWRAIDVIDGVLAVPDNESGWFAPACVRGLAGSWTERPDVIYSSAPPWTGQLVASRLAAVFGCPWVADFRDPWSRAPWRGDRLRFALRAAAMLERHVVRRADHIVFVAQGNHDDFAGHYGPTIASKFHVVANGCDPSEFDRLERPAVRPGDPFVLLHAGSLYAGRTPLPVVKAVVRAIREGVIDRRRFRLRFLGTVALQSVDLQGVCSELGLDDVVQFGGRVPREQSLRELVAASALLLLQPGHPVSVPGKLYEYLAAGRPIMAIADEGSETATLVRSSGIGVSVGDEDEDGIVRALGAVQQMARAGVVRPPREAFDGRIGAARIVALLDAIVAGRAVPARIAVEAQP